MAEKKTTAKKTTSTAEKKTAAAAKKTTAAAEKKTTAAKGAAAKKTTAAKTVARAVAPAAAKVPAAPAIKRARPLRRAPVAQGSVADSAPHSWRRSRRRTRVGVVSSAKQPHTVTVVVERMREHPLYKKVIRLRKKYAAHDAAGDVKAGDLVRIQESRPFSATKHWQVVEVLSRAGEAGAAAPRVADVEKYLEQAEGVDAILAPQREEKPEPVAEGTAE
ncbi:MAG TPA: 30S ribosomal protein S17 [Candidatus Limnocylindria bacterium]|nr:30S ribosomal protein S17 [Candidatus Limnocylindria bacterium]